MSRQMTQDQWIQSAVIEFEGPLVVYAARILGDIDRARDVVQETFLRLCGQERSEVGPHLLEWLYAVCRNRALDLLRRQRTRGCEEMAGEKIECPVARPAKRAEDKELAARILSMMEELPENQRRVLVLKFEEGLSYKQISVKTGLSVSNVGFLIHSGLKALRRGLEVGNELR